MKIKYIGNFNDGTGWAKASTYNALALDHAGYDVYGQEIKYNQNSVILNDRIVELLNKQSDNFDVVIQHVLPSEYIYFPNAKNIGFVALETLTLRNPLWLKKLNMMDEIFVPNSLSRECLRNSGITKNIKIFHHSFDYNKVANLVPVGGIDELKNSFNFVFVGEFTKRKNLEAVLRAFHSEFNYIEPVSLYIKTNRELKTVTDFCDAVRRNTNKTGRYKKEIIITGYLNEETLLSTVKQCHAFVMPSHGEAWCYPAMEAMALGLPAIYTHGIGIQEYASSDNYTVSATKDYCYGVNDAVDGLYTSEDLWLSPSIDDIRKKMRNVFNAFMQDRSGFIKKSNNVSSSVACFDYKNNSIVEGLL